MGVVAVKSIKKELKIKTVIKIWEVEMNKLKEMLKKLINKIGEENNKSFGNKRMDCCDLNKKK